MKRLFLLLLLLGLSVTGGSVTTPVPPPSHPRLYINPTEIPALRQRMQTPQGKAILKRMTSAAVPRTAEEEAAETDRGFRYYFKMRGFPMQAQLLALDYLAYGDTAAADRAVTGMLDTLKRTHFGTKKDLSRASGVMLMTGAIVYDWCYDRISADTRLEYIRQFKRIASTMECGWPLKHTEPLAGHTCEWMLLRDLLSAGIAVYDEDKEIYDATAGVIFEKYAPARDYVYAGGNYHQGSSYVNVRMTNDLIAQWIFTAMGCGPVFDKKQREVLYDAIYRRRPDGALLPSGDCNPPARRGKIQNYATLQMLASSYYGDAFLAREYELNPVIEPHCLILELLWRDFNLKSRGPETLPLVKYDGTPYGWMIARTSWDSEATIVEMKINEQFVGNHQHLDGGSFQIYHKGPLAIDSGMYQGSTGGYNSAHSKNYFKRTVAHNSLLVYDPGEKFECFNYGGEDRTAQASNDGGQRMPGEGWKTCNSLEALRSPEYTVGRVISHSIGEDFVTLKGDITAAYSRDKVSQVVRHFVFAPLDRSTGESVLLVFDRIVSKDPSFKKTFLLHCIEQPQIKGNGYVIKRTSCGDSGTLTCTVLLPADAGVTKVGGPGMEFWSAGQNWTNSRTDPAREAGAWRVEVSPGKPSCEDIFLNVIRIGQSDGDDAIFKDRPEPAPQLVETDSLAGAVTDEIAAVFASKGNTVAAANFSLPAGAKTRKPLRKVMVCDLAPGRYSVSLPGGQVLEKTVLEGENNLVFHAKPGEVSVVPAD